MGVVAAATGTLAASASAAGSGASALRPVGPARTGSVLRPVIRTFGEVTVPRVRTGTIQIPAGHASGRVRVIVTLRLPGLAAAHGGGVAYRVGGASQLNVEAPASRRYLSRVEAAQARAIATLHAAIPEARVSWRYQVTLDGFTVTLPYVKLDRLARLGFVNRIYGSMRYTLQLNRGPGLIGAPALSEATGARGDGVKIAVVDDGVDQGNAFFNPAGYAMPAGFPRGDTAYTTAKVIVAKSFPGPGAGAAGRLPLDRKTSFHGTHVAGIAAGVENTTAPAGPDHPTVTGLSGVAPHAYIGNYRVFSVPVPLFGGNVAESPEIAKAFDEAVRDGMDVINFSGGGPESEPSTDVMIETVRNAAAAGVVPVISAGNDRDEFGNGSVGSPGTAPDAITVAAVANSHVFGRQLTVDQPAGIAPFPFSPAQGGVPGTWADAGQPVVDVSRLTGRDGKPVDPLVCGSGALLNDGSSTNLLAGSLTGKIAVVARGVCTFVSKSERLKAAGAIGMIMVDNRSGDGSGVPIQLAIPAGMVSKGSGAMLRNAIATNSGQAVVRIGRDQLEIPSNGYDIPTYFSAAGPTPFGHDLKPDVAAPGGQILSSTLPEFAGSPFAVFDGTSMSSPHVAGAAALLTQRHPAWTTKQIKSALMTSAGPVYSDASKTVEASVLVEGAGLANLPGADDPRLFTDPQSLSFHDLSIAAGATSRQLLLNVSDAGNGAGTWAVTLAPQSQTAGVSISVPPSITVGPGGTVAVPVTATAEAGATPGDQNGFVILAANGIGRRIPYYFSVTRPGLASAPDTPIGKGAINDTRKGTNRAVAYRYPANPFGEAPDNPNPVQEVGGEQLYSFDIPDKAVNAGVAVLLQASGVAVDPWFLSAKDENTVQGYAGTPVSVSGSTFDFRAYVGAAGVVFPKAGRYYVAVDSGRSAVTGKSYAGPYVIVPWVNDLKPPRVGLITAKVAAGRPTVALRVVDDKSGVDPLNLVFAYGRTLIGAAAYDPLSGTALFPIPADAPALKAGKPSVIALATDNQETKNVNTIGENVIPNTAIAQGPLQVVNGPAVTWLFPGKNACTAASERLVVLAGSTAAVKEVAFTDGKKTLARVKKGQIDLFGATWKTKGATKGTHTLAATVTDARGRKATASVTVRVCK